MGSIVSVPLKTTLKDAVVIEEVKQPEFETAEIVSVSDKVYSTEQIEMAKFISEYYFSSFGEAISLFIPFWRKQRVIRNAHLLSPMNLDMCFIVRLPLTSLLPIDLKVRLVAIKVNLPWG